LRCTLGKVEGEGRLLGSEIVNIEHKVLWEVLGGSPQGPADTGIHQTVLWRQC
jgi:hypothetical protein